jgi:hypothetical protein
MTLRDLEWLSPFALDRPEHTPPGGHSHFWERAMSRRALFGTIGGAAAVAATAGASKPLRAIAGPPADPKPIPGGIVAAGQGWHVSGPGYNVPDTPSSGLAEQSTITDFNGAVGCTIVRGTGVGRQGGALVPLAFDSDMRFMQGRYIGVDGVIHTGTFGFI